MPGPLLYVGALAIGAGLAYLLTMDDDDEIEPVPDEPIIPLIPFMPDLLPPQVPPTIDVIPFIPSGQWDTAMWGTGAGMKWPAIRAAMVLWGWPAMTGTVASDINGAGCPGVGIASRASCTANNGLRNFQAGYNRMINRANAGATYVGADLFAGQTKLTVDGLLGPKSLNAFGRAMTWQRLHAGGPFGLDKLRLESIQ